MLLNLWKLHALAAIPGADHAGRVQRDPEDWVPGNGQVMSIMQNPALFSLLGTFFGGDGVTTFCLPDLRGRACVGSDLAAVPMGQMDGTETVTLTIEQLPYHSHDFQATTVAGSGRTSSPVGKVFGTNTAANETIFAATGSNYVPLSVGTNVTPQGGGAPHNNMQPYLTINYMIALYGLYPSRP